ncbi:MAG TPA: ABC transporter ATP-binding protein [Casimicrobiaceae bacterium]|nr:ABC transporter ATP-binding protein [Casimicrobiaceae bacterium]
MTEPVLAATALGRRFGGLVAVDDVSLSLAPRTVHAVIGPNGAGKSTLVNLLSGELRPSTGTIRLGTLDITHWPSHRIAQHGVARSFQHTNVFGAFSAFENCRLAAQSHHRNFNRWFRPAERYRDWNAAAETALATVGLAARAGIAAAALSHGERRALEIAMALATHPTVLLLDEPLAGMGPEESAYIVSLLKRLAADHAILLVEHDMDAVFALADRLTVMVNGRILASGAPEAIRANAEVQRAYLGTEAVSAL